MYVFRRMILVGGCLLFVFLSGCIHQTSNSPSSALQSTPLIEQRLTTYDKTVGSEIAEALGQQKPLQPYNYIIYEWLACDVGWNQSCEDTILLEAPAGWQVCKIYYGALKQGGHGSSWSNSPTNWYTNDPESPDRFRALSLHLKAWGNNDPIINPTGAIIRFDNLGLKLLPANADNHLRYTEGCTMPAHD